jgi:hypothetical protein
MPSRAERKVRASVELTIEPEGSRHRLGPRRTRLFAPLLTALAIFGLPLSSACQKKATPETEPSLPQESKKAEESKLARAPETRRYRGSVKFTALRETERAEPLSAGAASRGARGPKKLPPTKTPDAEAAPETIRDVEVALELMDSPGGAPKGRVSLEGAVQAVGEGNVYEGELRLALAPLPPRPGRGFVVLTQLAPEVRGHVEFWDPERSETLKATLNGSTLKAETP